MKMLICVLPCAAVAAFSQSLPNLLPIPDPAGFISTFNTNNNDGPIDLTGPFFQSLGTNGRSCATCHQPSDGWTVSATHVEARFDATAGLDPIFRTVDGSNCDHNIDVSHREGRRKAYSLLRTRGLIRIGLSPPAGAEFDVVHVDNPYGCNETTTVSMYRRPLPATNLRFLSTVMWDGRESSTPTGTTPITSLNYPASLLADLAHQSFDATNGHEQATVPLSPQQQQQIVAFETGLFTAQAFEFGAGPLDGPKPLAAQPFFIGINDPLGMNPTHAPFTPVIFTLDSPSPAIARGQALFNSKTIRITGVAGLNDAAGMPVIQGTCGTCHDTFNVGNHSVSAPLNIGVADLTNPLGVDYLPVITLRNRATGAIMRTTDVGRAMITGQWQDIGKLKGPVLRGLASRAPYFHNGSAESLQDVVTFYDKRFQIRLSENEKQDLVAFLNSL